jgi:hypothetical protein
VSCMSKALSLISCSTSDSCDERPEVHACVPSTQAEEGGLFVQGQPGLHSEFTAGMNRMPAPLCVKAKTVHLCSMLKLWQGLGQYLSELLSKLHRSRDRKRMNHASSEPESLGADPYSVT